MKWKRNKKSFTLVETLAAALLLSLSVVILSGISVHSLRMSQSIMIYEQAWDLADRQLTMVDCIGIRKYILSGPTEGIFEGDRIKYDWQIKVTESEEDFLYDVKITVGWIESKNYKTVRVQTRLSGYE